MLAKYVDAASKASGDEVRDALKDLSPSSIEKLLLAVSCAELPPFVQAASAPGVEDKLAVEGLPHTINSPCLQEDASNQDLLAKYVAAASTASVDEVRDAFKALPPSSFEK